MAKDLIVGVVDNYDWDKIKYWANSIKQSGFDGYKALIVFNMDAPTVRKLTEEGFSLIGVNQFDEEKGFVYTEPNRSIMVDRFFYIHNLIKMLDDSMDVSRVVITDVRDVVFQDNPSNWMDHFFLHGFDLIVGSENLNYADEPWGKNNIAKSFGEYFFEQLHDAPIYCAGVIAGTTDSIRDMCLNLYLICKGLNPHVEGGGGPDQAALNIMLDLGVYEFSTLFTDPSSGWVLHAGTSLPAIQAGSGGIGQAYMQNPNMPLPFLMNLEYSIDNNDVFVNGQKITILHQWDRVPAWKRMIEEKYGAN